MEQLALGPHDKGVTVALNGRPRVLVVEDDEDLALGLTVILSRELEVELAPCARDALRTLEEVQPDVLLLDYQLPDMNGIRLLEAIARRATRRVPAIMLSAFPSRADASKRAGFVEFLEKPCDTAALLWSIQCALGAQEALPGRF